MSNSRYSLVLTANRRNFLREALISVCAQDDQDFEFMVCLDTSIDTGLSSYVNPLIKCMRCSSVRVISVEGNGTAGFIRNIGFRESSGEWISYIDGDDMLAPSAISSMKKYIYANDSIDIFTSGMLRISIDGITNQIPESLTYYPPLNIYTRDPEKYGEPTFFNQFQFIRKDCWEYYKYDETTNGEDIDFMLHQLLQFRFLKVPHYLYYYRDVLDSFSKKNYPQKDITTLRYLDGYYYRIFQESEASLPFENFLYLN